ncbi:MAG: hypothetical protein ACKPBB_23740 [Sphaerospermopsis kisseleviana]
MIGKHKIDYPVTSHQSPVTCHLSPVTCHLFLNDNSAEVQQKMNNR